jgi:Ca2+/Na+ antiporter
MLAIFLLGLAFASTGAALDVEISSTNSDALDALLIFVLIIGLLICFVGIAIVCDDHLVTIIEHYVEVLHIPDQVAGATLLAFASSVRAVIIVACAVH